MTGTTVGHYRVLRKLGEGGMGVVYEAEDTRLGRHVALKFLPDRLASDHRALDRFQREARAASALNHPHICTIHDIDESDGQPFIAMELLEGTTLRERLAGGRPSVAAAIETTLQLADALETAHAKGIVHRDLKPENVFLTTRGTAKLLDFGIATLAAEALAATGALTVSRAQTGEVALGTLAYMSPEQVRAEPLDGRTDLFSLGVVLYELLTGAQPFRGTTSGAVIGEILTKAPTAPVRLNADVPTELERILNKLLEKDRELRYQSARDVRVDLERLRQVMASAPDRSRPMERPVATASERPSIIVLPFENLSPDPENAFFADGLTEEIIADLSRIQSLRVISRTSAMMFKGVKKSAPAIAAEVNVRHVLEGSVRRAGNNLRITVQLIDASSDDHVWTEKYSGTLDDVFAIQEQVSQAIAAALRLTLTAGERHRLAARAIRDIKAFDRYLEARHASYQVDEPSLDRAVRLTREALDLTGPNALLYALLAEIEFFFLDQNIHQDEARLITGEAWARKALEIDPENAAALRALGLIEARQGHLERAIRDLRRSNELQACGETLFSLAWLCPQVGAMEAARRYAADAVAVDPLLWFSHWSRAWVALFDGEFTTALQRWQDPLRGDDDSPTKQWFSAIFALYAGQIDQACDWFARFAEVGHQGMRPCAAALASAFRRDPGSSTLFHDPGVSLAARRDKEMSWWLAAALSHLGAYDEAMYWLTNAVNLGFVNAHVFSKIDPFLAPLRGDTRFEQLMEHAREKERAILAALL